MKVAVERVTKAGRGARERSHLPDEGEDDREGVGGRGNEGDMEDGGCVDYRVDCC